MQLIVVLFPQTVANIANMECFQSTVQLFDIVSSSPQPSSGKIFSKQWISIYEKEEY